jgi:hypothetical protein
MAGAIRGKAIQAKWSAERREKLVNALFPGIDYIEEVLLPQEIIMKEHQNQQRCDVVSGGRVKSGEEGKEKKLGVIIEFQTSPINAPCIERFKDYIKNNKEVHGHDFVLIAFGRKIPFCDEQGIEVESTLCEKKDDQKFLGGRIVFIDVRRCRSLMGNNPHHVFKILDYTVSALGKDWIQLMSMMKGDEYPSVDVQYIAPEFFWALNWLRGKNDGPEPENRKHMEIVRQRSLYFAMKCEIAKGMKHIIIEN